MTFSDQIKLSSPSHEVLFVTGKGGVGKTELSCRLAEHAASKGIKTLIVELNGSKSIATRYRISPSYSSTILKPRLFALSITPEEAIREYALKQLKFQSLYKMIFQNRYVKPLVQGAPGLQEDEAGGQEELQDQS